MLERIHESAEWLKPHLRGTSPKSLIILGSGLGLLQNSIEIIEEIPYGNIPNFPVSTVEGHAGTLIVGRLEGKDVLAMNGRFHYYEGYSTRETTFPIRVFRELGVTTLFASNAAGGTNPSFKIGDLMLITDHINFLPDHPLRGKNVPQGPRFPEMSAVYSERLNELAKRIASELGFNVREGVYLATQGPTYETPAEYRLFRMWGADAVGMSTVPEVIVAHHCGMECFGISVITNSGQKNAFTTHDEVKEAANLAGPRMVELLKRLI